jgi:hypothetical protein
MNPVHLLFRAMVAYLEAFLQSAGENFGWTEDRHGRWAFL